MASFKDIVLATHKKLYEDHFNKAEYFLQQKTNQLIVYSEEFKNSLPQRALSTTEHEIKKT